MARTRNFEVKSQNVYCDWKSLEKSTNILKKKYKIAGNTFPDVCTFFILCGDNNACNARTTVTINQADFLNRNTIFLTGSCSYLDVLKVEFLSVQEILLKRKDEENRFPFVARLSDKKYLEVKETRKKVKRGYDFVDKKANIVDIALESLDTATEKLKELGLE